MKNWKKSCSLFRYNVILVPGWNRCFSWNLDSSKSDDCLGRFKSRIMSFFSDWSNKEAGNNQQLLLKLSTDMSSSVEVKEYLSVSSSSRSGKQLNTGFGATTIWGIGLKLIGSLDTAVDVCFSYWSISHLPCRSNVLQHCRYFPSRSSECQKEDAYLFHGTMISKFPHSLHQLYVEPVLYLDPEAWF